MPNATAGFFNVTVPPWSKVNVAVGNRLASRFTVVEPDVEPDNIPGSALDIPSRGLKWGRTSVNFS